MGAMDSNLLGVLFLCIGVYSVITCIFNSEIFSYGTSNVEVSTWVLNRWGPYKKAETPYHGTHYDNTDVYMREHPQEKI